jgi:hypothetical protein
VGHEASADAEGKRLVSDLVVIKRGMRVVWPGAVLADDYATAAMEDLLAKLGAAAGKLVLTPPLQVKGGGWAIVDTRLVPEVNFALGLVKIAADRRIAEVMDAQPVNYYGPIQYRVEISSPRLIAAAERGLRVEVDPEYADFMHRARRAAERLGRAAVRSICGEGGVDLSSEQGLEELVALDAEAGTRPVAYNRHLGRWVVAEEHVKEQAKEDA